MPNHELYCVEVPFVRVTLDAPDGPVKTTMPGGYATGTGNVLLYTDLDHAKVATFPKAKAEKIAEAWRKKDCRVHVRVYEPAREPELV